MTKSFCDRCGVEIKPGKYAWINHKTIYARLTTNSAGQRIGEKERDVIICSECEDSYIHWFMNPNEEYKND